MLGDPSLGRVTSQATPSRQGMQSRRHLQRGCMARVAEPLWTPGFCRGSRLHARACENIHEELFASRACLRGGNERRKNLHSAVIDDSRFVLVAAFAVMTRPSTCLPSDVPAWTGRTQ